MNEYAKKQIDAIAETSKRIKPLVAIRCATFNHEPYIRNAGQGKLQLKCK